MFAHKFVLFLSYHIKPSHVLHHYLFALGGWCSTLCLITHTLNIATLYHLALKIGVISQDYVQFHNIYNIYNLFQDTIFTISSY
jgi:hypothetical protein